MSTHRARWSTCARRGPHGNYLFPIMNEVTVSAVLVVPPIRGGQQRIKGLVPAMRLQQLNLQGSSRRTSTPTSKPGAKPPGAR